MTNRIGILGDTHGKTELMRQTIHENDECDLYLHIGDCGLIDCPELPDAANVRTISRIIESMEDEYVWFLRGNHDNPTYCKQSSNYIADDTLFEFGGVKFWCCGGAKSTDAHLRIPGIDWVHDEELSIEEWGIILANRKFMEADVILTHDCPQSVFLMMDTPCPVRRSEQSRTRQMLELIWNTIKQEGDPERPLKWFNGHHHKPFKLEINQDIFQTVPQDDMTILYISEHG